MPDPRGKIQWTDSTGTVHSFNFQYPATSIPFAVKKAIRFDNLADSGVKETVLQRIDRFTMLSMEAVIAGDDISNWDTFTDYALTGAAFQFFPDYTSSSFTTYTLEDMDWQPDYKAPGMYSFKVKFRQVVS